MVLRYNNTMTYRTSITLEEQTYQFLMKSGIENKSAYINDLLKREQEKSLAEKIAMANAEEAEYLSQNYMDDWDETLSDGLDD